MEGQQAGTPVEGEVTVEGMSAALEDLAKAAEATDLLSKGNGSGIEHSGHVDERGKVGGGRATASDAGGLDKMMIAKLSEAGFDLQTISDFNAFLVGKLNNEEEEEEEEEEEGAEKGGQARQEEPLVKSIDDFKGDPDIASAVDVSPYLEALTVKVSEHIDRLGKSITDGQDNQGEVNRRMAAALYQIGTLIKSQAQVIDVLGERLNIVEKQPQQQKGKTDLTGAQPLSKSMPGEAGGSEPLTKAETLSTLSYMRMEKGIKDIGGQDVGQAIYLLEGGNVMDPSIRQAVEHFLTANPTEAQAARIYR